MKGALARPEYQKERCVCGKRHLTLKSLRAGWRLAKWPWRAGETPVRA